MHILIIDDDSLVGEVLTLYLEALGYTSVHALSGQEGVRMYRESDVSIDAVILDMTMPVMGGAECFVKLQAINPNVKVLLSSGYAKESLQDQFEEGSLAGYLTKPFVIKDLQKALDAILK